MGMKIPYSDKDLREANRRAVSAENLLSAPVIIDRAPGGNLRVSLRDAARLTESLDEAESISHWGMFPGIEA